MAYAAGRVAGLCGVGFPGALTCTEDQCALPPRHPAVEHVLHAQVEAQQADAPMLYRLPHMKMWTKLRPGVRQFLEQAKERQALEGG